MKINVDTFIDEMNNTGADQMTIKVTFTKGQKNYTLKLCIEEEGTSKTKTETFCRPRECVNAGCVAACCTDFYEANKVFFKDNPKNCLDFKKEEKLSKLPEERHAMGYKGETNK